MNAPVCKECGQELIPNYMEGCWEHFATGCKWTGYSTRAMVQPQYSQVVDDGELMAKDEPK